MTADAPCAFCAWREKPTGTRVWDDDVSFAEVDVRQPHSGHVLVMPHRHVENLFELDEPLASALMITTVRIARAVRAALSPDGLSLWQSNGPGAHQEVPHFHMHIMPRWVDDGLLRIYPRRLDPADRTARETMATEIRRALT